MSHEFVHPNWHIVFIHYPLGLLTVGIVIEIFSFLWKRSSVRVAGHWMILLGALACIPTLTMGLYAFRDVVSPQPIDDQDKWYDVVQTSSWLNVQWEHMNSHIWLASSATVLFVLASIVWLCCSNFWRERLYMPTVIVVLVAMGLISAGAWYAGETVYVDGTAVGDHRINPAAAQSDMQSSGTPSTAPHVAAPYADQRDEYSASRPEQSAIEAYVPPLQLHLLLAGMTVAAALGAFGASIRRWTQEAPTTRPDISLPPAFEPIEIGRPVPPPRVFVPETQVMGIAVRTPPTLWLLATLLGVGTVLAGLWFTGDWKFTALTVPLQNPFARKEMQRLFGHVLFGASIVLLALLLAGSTRFIPRSRALTGVLSTLLIVAILGQVWLGILMLYDSTNGPLTGFNTL